MIKHSLIVDLEQPSNLRTLEGLFIRNNFQDTIKEYQTRFPDRVKNVVQYVDSFTGETVKGPKYDTTTMEMFPEMEVGMYLKQGVKQQDPIEPSEHQPRDRFQENKNMSELTKFRNIVRECISEIKKENDPRSRLKESLRAMVKKTLNEISNVNNPEPDKEEKEKISKGYTKNGNERLDKTNEKLIAELESLVHNIDPTWEAYIDDHRQFIVRAQNLLYVRICPKYENNFDVDAMVKLVDRVRAIALTWEQVKSFVKANFSDLKKHTNADRLVKKSVDNEYGKGVNQKSAGPDNDVIKNRGEKRNGEDSKIKDTKKTDKDYNEPLTKRDEDLPDQPMKQVTEPGKDPEGKNKNISKTDKVKPEKFKNDKKLKVSDKKTPKFVKKQVGA